MSLLRAAATVSSFTLLSRITGLARDIVIARTFGAGALTDAFWVAFRIPNLLRRLFAEGAFSVAFVPMYSRRLAGENGEDEAAKFANDVLSVFIWVLLAFSGLAMLAMPGIVWLLASEFQSVPGKFDLAVFLSRVTFPYLMLVSLVAMLSGLLNARSRFAPLTPGASPCPSRARAFWSRRRPARPGPRTGFRCWCRRRGGSRDGGRPPAQAGARLRLSGCR